MQGVDGVFHVAGWYKIGAHDNSHGEKVNVQGTRTVLELMKELRIPKGVYTSTHAVNSDTHGELKDEFFASRANTSPNMTVRKPRHIRSLKTLSSKDLPLVIAMPGGIYGPGYTSTLRRNLIDFEKGKLPAMPTQAGICLGACR